MMQNPSATSAKIMQQVSFALVPGMVCLAWFSPGWLLILFTTSLGAVATEAICVRLQFSWFYARQRIKDGSALLTGMLLAICLPPASPVWLGLVGGSVAIAIGKHIYGGLGTNPFNPAMVGYLVLLLGFPQVMTLWSTAALSGPTLLDRANELNPGQWFDTAWFHYNLVVNVTFALGGLWLLNNKIVRLRIPLGVLAGYALAFIALEGPNLKTLGHHFLVGSLLFGAFFIATDPVSGPFQRRAQIGYALGIGALTALIQQGHQYPDGFAFAVILMNILGPTLDRFAIKRSG